MPPAVTYVVAHVALLRGEPHPKGLGLGIPCRGCATVAESVAAAGLRPADASALLPWGRPFARGGHKLANPRELNVQG